MKNVPKIPEKVWWTIRAKFADSVPGAVTASYLTSLLEVNESSAKTYLPELKLLHLIDENGKPTPEANEWRLDSSYNKVCSDIVTRVYPEEVRDLFPGPTFDRSACIEWFKRNLGVGASAARQYATTYMLLKTPLDVAGGPASKKLARQKRDPKPVVRRGAMKADDEKGQDSTPGETRRADGVWVPPVHVNLQIHISPDATNEQIEAIFKNMRKYLMNNG
ncbi:MAG: DUF5343 domain-containing protein [Ignavibacteriales bacterium]